MGRTESKVPRLDAGEPGEQHGDLLGPAVRGSSDSALHVEGDVTPRRRPSLVDEALHLIEKESDHGSDSARTLGTVRRNVVCGYVRPAQFGLLRHDRDDLEKDRHDR